MFKNNFLLTIIICIMLLTSSIFAGIYQAVVLQSPDGSQRVRIYFDNHSLGSAKENLKQFNIINESIKNFIALDKQLDILVEFSDYYRPFEDQWANVIGEKEHPKHLQRLTQRPTEFAKETIKPKNKIVIAESENVIKPTSDVPATDTIGSTEGKKKTSKLKFTFTSSLQPIPLIIGKTISHANKKINIISIDPRMLYSPIMAFMIGNIVPPSNLENMSLKDIFTDVDEKMRTGEKTIFIFAPQHQSTQLAPEIEDDYKGAAKVAKELEIIKEKIKKIALEDEEINKNINLLKQSDQSDVVVTDNIEKENIRLMELQVQLKILLKSEKELKSLIQQYNEKMKNEGHYQEIKSEKLDAIASQQKKITDANIQKMMPGKIEEEKFKQYHTKIESAFATLTRENNNFIKLFEETFAKIKSDAWTRKFDNTKTFKENFTPDEQRIIKSFFYKPIIENNWLEYVALKHIFEQGAAHEVAIFVGGHHAKKLVNILTNLDYITLYKKGYTIEFVDEVCEEKKVDQSISPYGVVRSYSGDMAAIINNALEETLTPDAISYDVILPATFFLPKNPFPIDRLLKASLFHDLQTVQDIILERPELINTKSNIGFEEDITPLHAILYGLHLCRGNEGNTMPFPLKDYMKGENVTFECDKQKATAIIRSLLESGANPYIIDGKGQSAFDILENASSTKVDRETIKIFKAENKDLEPYINISSEDILEKFKKNLTDATAALKDAEMQLKEGKNIEQKIEESETILSRLHYLLKTLADDYSTKINTEGQKELLAKIALIQRELLIKKTKTQREQMLTQNISQQSAHFLGAINHLSARLTKIKNLLDHF